eukprot:749456-Hanusia_phi.AAC.1
MEGRRSSSGFSVAGRAIRRFSESSGSRSREHGVAGTELEVQEGYGRKRDGGGLSLSEARLARQQSEKVAGGGGVGG